jgi:quercetin dioxygenase-like cupin family protein
MPLPQDITPINADVVESLVRSADSPWIPQPDNPEKAFIRVLWTGEQNGQSALIFRWLKGYQPLAHKHLGSSHSYILSGKLQVRDAILNPGDYVYEPNGVIHESTRALEDTEYLFIFDGAMLFIDQEQFLGYFNWEVLRKWSAKHQARTSGT